MTPPTKMELDTLLKVIAERGFQPLGLIFYDPTTCLLGIAPMEAVPDAWVEMIGKRLSGLDNVKQNWQPLHQA
jgi:hypothetical protein